PFRPGGSARFAAQPITITREMPTMSFDPQPFRQQYRAAIRPGYNPWLHAGFVLAYGGAWIGFFLSRLEQPSLLEWLTVPAALVFFNWGEY
ncbi:hypothetical protein K3X07_14750, partial [Listeria monocytogenes]|nr:hypothetical protein [Listeria monocytogenes]